MRDILITAIKMAAGFLPPPPAVSVTEMATSVAEIRQVHAQILKTGHSRDPFTASRIVATNPDPLTISYAHSIFDRIDHPNSFTWNAIIRAYANGPNPETALSLFHQMLHDDSVFPDSYTFTFALKACSGFSGLEEGRQLHCQALKVGAGCDEFIQNTLIRMYGANERTEIARQVFDEMTERDLYSYNALLSSYAERGEMGLARELFDGMGERCVESWNYMVSGYVGVGLVEEGRKLFEEMPVRNVVSWDVMISSYADLGSFGEVMTLFQDMQNAEVMTLFQDMQNVEVKPNDHILVNVLSACARSGALREGEMVREYIDENGIRIVGELATALADMYYRCGNVEKAIEVLKNTASEDASIWNSVIAGLNSHGFTEHALQIFSEMVAEGFTPNEDIFTSILSACSHARLLNEGREMFDLMVRVYGIHGIQPTAEHYGCMVDLFCGVGLLEEAEEVVRAMPQEEAYAVWEYLLGYCKNHDNSEMAKRVVQKLSEFSSESSAHAMKLRGEVKAFGWNKTTQ